MLKTYKPDRHQYVYSKQSNQYDDSYDGSIMSSKEQTGLRLTLNNDSNYKTNIPVYPNFFSIPDL